jgi:hypothetical protein
MADNNKGAGKSGHNDNSKSSINQQTQGGRNTQSNAGQGSRGTAQTGAGKSEGQGDNTRSENNKNR